MPENMVKGFNVNGSTVQYDYESLSDRILKSSIGNEYSSLSTYKVGEYVLYAGQLYRCIVEVTTPQNFDSSKWEAVSVGDDLKYIKKYYCIDDGIKQALLNLLSHVAYTDEHGQDYYDELEAELFRTADLVSISAVFNQGQNVIYDTDSLDTLRQYLVVTATYDDSSTGTVTGYTLSGTLTAGTSTITVSYGGKTATFVVTVTHALVPAGYTAYDYIRYTGADYNGNGNPKTQIKTKKFDNLNNLVIDFDFMPYVAQEGSAAGILGGQKEGTSGNGSTIVFYARTDTQRVSVFSHGSAIGINDNPNVQQGKIAHVNLNPHSESPSTLTVDSITENAAWTDSQVINSEIGYCGKFVSNTTQNYSTIKNFAAIGILRLYDLSNNLIGEYIPCNRDSDNVVGIYDTVTETFYTTDTVTYATTGNANCVWTVGNWEVE